MELLGLKITKLENHEPAWHPDVAYYEVKDAESDKVMGHFYLDLHPRPNKYNHAAVFQLVKRAMIDGKLRTPTVAMVTNFRAPTATKPSLLGHAEVKTFFHEFGHVMHNVCSEAMNSRFSGASVERDFVEMPSQMLENWVVDKEILKRISKHYKTGKPLNDTQIDQIAKGKENLKALHTMHQIFQGTYDLLLYSAFDKKLLKAPTQLS